MRKITIALTALLVTATVAAAACPPNMPYNCTQGWNGKVICRCGY
jgi:hypothetical protein